MNLSPLALLVLTAAGFGQSGDCINDFESLQGAVEVLGLYPSTCSILGELEDSSGTKLVFVWEGCDASPPPRADEPRKLPEKQVYVGAINSDDDCARYLAVGGAEETKLLNILRQWTNATLPEDVQGKWYSVYWDKDLDKKAKESRLSILTEKERLSLRVLQLIILVEENRNEVLKETVK